MAMGYKPAIRPGRLETIMEETEEDANELRLFPFEEQWLESGSHEDAPLELEILVKKLESTELPEEQRLHEHKCCNQGDLLVLCPNPAPSSSNALVISPWIVPACICRPDSETVVDGEVPPLVILFSTRRAPCTLLAGSFLSPSATQEPW